MADDGLIAAYLRELGYSVARLSDAADIVAEAEDHLHEAAGWLGWYLVREPAVDGSGRRDRLATA